MAVIKYREVFIGIQNFVYEVSENPNKLGKRISKEEARKRIKSLGLVKVYTSDDGEIWDYPHEPFFTKYKGVEIKDM